MTTEHEDQAAAPGDPEISVIIPAYNEARFIGEAIESALAQTFEDIEVIVVDDGSTDDTVARVASYTDPRLRLIRLPHSGLATARNSGISNARGNFVAFLDADDLWHPAKLQRHLDAFKDNDTLDMTFSLSRVIDVDGREIGFVVPRRSGVVTFEQLFRENLVRNGSAAVLKAGVMNHAGLFDPELEASTDLDMWLRIARLRNDNVYCIGECLTLYRRRPGQTTSDRQRMERSWQQVSSKVLSDSPSVTDTLLSKANSDKHFYFACLAYESGEYSTALSLLGTCFKWAPLSALLRLRPWMLSIACVSGMLLPSKVHQQVAGLGTRGAQAASGAVLFAYRLFARSESA